MLEPFENLSTSHKLFLKFFAPNDCSLLGLMCTGVFSEMLRINTGGKIHKGHVTGVYTTLRNPETKDLLCVPNPRTCLIQNKQKTMISRYCGKCNQPTIHQPPFFPPAAMRVERPLRAVLSDGSNHACFCVQKQRGGERWAKCVTDVCWSAAC